MKKILLRVLIVLVVIAGIGYIVVPNYFTKMITVYERITHEDVFGNPEQIEHFHIGTNKGPADYGFADFDVVNYPSLFDDLNLNGWYIPASKDSIGQTLLILHGRTSNRLKTMKYLEIVKDYGLDSLYNVFVPDLRNSGKSDESVTAMGYEFSEDIAASMKMLHQKYGQTNFTLFGFSMGAMASAITTGRPDVVSEWKDDNLEIDKLILGSPLCNVPAQLRFSSDAMGVPGFIFNMAFKKFDGIVDGWSDNMKISHLIEESGVPTLVLYSDGDTTTPAVLLEEELKSLPAVRTEKFSGVEHVQLYTEPDYKVRYAEAINDFLRN